MRLPLLSLAASFLILGAVWAQNAGEKENMPQLPVGQTFVQFEFPVYQDGQLKYTGSAARATGITLNRAEATGLKIDVYDKGAVTTTVTSPKADLYINEQKMRTKNTVQIENANMEATSQVCDFDLKTKKYLLRSRVRVLLKHFDVNPPTSASPRASAAAPASVTSGPARSGPSLLESPGSYAETNSAPIPPSDTQ